LVGADQLIDETGPLADERADARAAQPTGMPPVGGIRRLARAASGSFALNVVNLGASVLTTIVLARVMTVAEFGIYSWVVATVMLLMVPVILGLDRLIVRDVAVFVGRGAHGLVRGLLRTSSLVVLGTCTAVGLLVVAVLLVGGSQVDPSTAAALAIGIIALPAMAYGRIAQSVLMGFHQVVLGQLPDLLLRPLLLLGVVGLVVVVSGVPLEAPTAVAAYTVSAVAIALVALVLMRRTMRARLQPAAPEYEWRRWLTAAAALTLLSGAFVVHSQTGVVLLGVLDSPESAGLYAVAQRGALLVAFPLLALNAALAPTAARLWSTRHVDELQRLVTAGTRGVLLGALPIAIIFIVFGSQLLGFVFGQPFSAAGVALAILCVGQLANTATGSVATLLIMSGNQALAAVGMGLGMLANVVLAVLLIPTLGVAGAAIAAATGLIVSNLIHVILARRTLGIDTTAIGLPARHLP
ncbi:MAG TPA: oligosaccharide flippase family protein, partial [Candidatus Limnocylindrales bacterium]|nr:oligosaccharide flippase family protein [Candidatus Limnocylindrales bacterium]